MIIWNQDIRDTLIRMFFLAGLCSVFFLLGYAFRQARVSSTQTINYVFRDVYKDLPVPTMNKESNDVLTSEGSDVIPHYIGEDPVFLYTVWWQKANRDHGTDLYKIITNKDKEQPVKIFSVEGENIIGEPIWPLGGVDVIIPVNLVDNFTSYYLVDTTGKMQAKEIKLPNTLNSFSEFSYNTILTTLDKNMILMRQVTEKDRKQTVTYWVAPLSAPMNRIQIQL